MSGVLNLYGISLSLAGRQDLYGGMVFRNAKRRFYVAVCEPARTSSLFSDLSLTFSVAYAQSFLYFVCPLQPLLRMYTRYHPGAISRSSHSSSLRRAESLEFNPSLLQIIIDDNLIMHTWRLGELNLMLGLLEASENRLLAIRSAASQPLLQNLHRRRLQEEEAGVQIRLLDLLDTLYHCLHVSGLIHEYFPQPLSRQARLTSISISKIHVLPFSLTSLTACTLVPYKLLPNCACSMKPLASTSFVKSSLVTKW